MMVLTATGPEAIEEVQVGDHVLARDETTGEVGYRQVTGTWERVYPIVELAVAGEDGEVANLRLTGEHPLWVEGRGWTGVGDLEPGQTLVTPDGFATVVGLTATDQVETVHNLTVEGWSTFFVFDGDTLGVWSHNCDTTTTQFRRIDSQGLDVFDSGLDGRRNFEILRGANLDPPNNFPAIDRMNRSSGLGTSMKTIDLRSAYASRPDDFRRVVRGHIESLRSFTGPAQRRASALGGQVVSVPRLRSRRLELGVQADMLTPAQRSILREEGRRAARLRNPVAFHVFEIF